MRTPLSTPLAAIALVLMAGVAPAEEGAFFMPLQNKAAKTECTACHMGFSASMLPQRSWKAIMSDLSNHFGEDASLDADTTKEIEDYLVAHASDTSDKTDWATWKVAQSETPLRITELPWWERAHRWEVPKWAWKKVGSKANCSGCHRGADQTGYFYE